MRQECGQARRVEFEASLLHPKTWAAVERILEMPSCSLMLAGSTPMKPNGRVVERARTDIRMVSIEASRLRPNPSLKLTRYGRRCKPGPRHVVHHREPGLQRLPPRAA
jgi:hypothetical protein